MNDLDSNKILICEYDIGCPRPNTFQLISLLIRALKKLKFEPNIAEYSEQSVYQHLTKLFFYFA